MGTTRESSMNIPVGMLMDVLVGDGMRLGVLIGLNTEDRPMVHAFFGDRDELFGEKYIARFLRHYPEHQCHRIPSGHPFSEEGAREIVCEAD